MIKQRVKSVFGLIPGLGFCLLATPMLVLADTVRDEFSIVSYSGSDGTAAWSTDWWETGETTDPGSGVIQVVSGRLRLGDLDAENQPDPAVVREANLIGASSATFTYDYEAVNIDNKGIVTVQVSGDGGSNWNTLTTHGINAGTGSESFDITSYIASNTQIRFQLNDKFAFYLYVDNIQIEYATGGTNHFSISHDGSAVNCQAEVITIRAHDVSHAADSGYSGTIALSTSTSHGDWSLVTGAGTLTNSGNGAGTYAFDAADAGVVVLGLRDTFTETTNINVVAGSAIEDPGEDANLVYASTGFNFLADAAKNTIGLQIGGKASNVTPGLQTLELEAIRTSDDTSACEAALTGPNTIELAFECENPGACTANQVAISGTNIAGNPNGAVTSYTDVSLDFGDATDTTATFSFAYPDVGQLQLHARLTLAPSGESLLGVSNAFVVRPFAFDVAATGNPAATSSAGSVFTSAGTDFTSTARAVLWTAADDLDNDGIADNHNDSNPANNANLADNFAALNYGQESVVELVALTATLDQPAAGVDPGLAGGTSIGVFAAGSGATSSARYDEVGIIELAAGIADGNYLGIGAPATAAILGRSGYVGRFDADHFTTAVNVPAFATVCAAGSYSYIGETFAYASNPVITVTARTLAGGLAANYTGGFFKIDNASLPDPVYTAAPASLDTTGLPSGASDPVVADAGAGVGTLTFSSGSGLLFTRGAEESAFDADIQVSINVLDADGAAASGNPITFGNPGGILFSAGANMRYGRGRLLNAYGSELVNLPLPFRTEYYVDAATGFVPNTDDNCSGAISLSLGAYTGNLVAGETCVLDSGAPGDSGAGCAAAAPAGLQYREPPLAGDFNLILQAPGGTNDGSTTATADVPDWLEFDWDLASPGNEDPTGTAVFGIFRGQDRRIYTREIY